MWREEYRDFGEIAPKRTGKVFITTSRENIVNVRESYGLDSSIIHKLANNIAVEEIQMKKAGNMCIFIIKMGDII